MSASRITILRISVTLDNESSNDGLSIQWFKPKSDFFQLLEIVF